MKPQVEFRAGTLHIKAEGRRPVDRAIRLIELLERIKSGESISQSDIKKIHPNHRHHIVKAICLRQAKGVKIK